MHSRTRPAISLSEPWLSDVAFLFMVEPDREAGRGGFPPTHWSVVLAAGHGTSEELTAAFEQLYRAYVYPLYVYARRTDHSPEDASDLTQGFFEHLWRNHALASADPSRGRFRSFVLRCFRNYLGSEHARASTLKRGGRWPPLSFEADGAEERFARHATDIETPEILYERTWALAVLDEALRRLSEEFERTGRAQTFGKLRPLLDADGSGPPYAVLARELHTTEGTVRNLAYRLRRRYRETLRAVVLQTVDSPVEVDDELRHLLEVLRGSTTGR